MKVVRLIALIGSLILIVVTAVSFVNRRGDVRNDQRAQVERASAVATTSIRSNVTGARDSVALAAVAMSRSAGSDDRDLAIELARTVTGSEACVGTTGGGCTGTDLFALDAVSALAVASSATADSGGTVSAAIGLDPASETVVVVRRISDGTRTVTAALRFPLAELIGPDARAAIDADDVDVVLTPQSRTEPDSSEVVERGGRRVEVDVVSAAFGAGSVVVESSVESTLGLAGDQTARYLLQLAVGTVLLALAGWTYRAERRHLERRATTDDLTELINRREFERISEEQLDIAHRNDAGVCVMIIDLNGFKQINDRLGHQFGDLVLTAASERFIDAVRDTDVVGRWGGDEFVILLPGLSERTAVRDSAERILNKLASSPVVGDTTISASIGAAIYPRHGTTFDALMRAADVAMYDAKSIGVGHRIADTMAVRQSLLDVDVTDGDDDSGGVPRADEVAARNFASLGLPAPDSASAEPAAAESGTPGSVTSDPVTSDPVTPDPVTSDPVTSDPTTPGSVPTESEPTGGSTATESALPEVIAPVVVTDEYAGPDRRRSPAPPSPVPPTPLRHPPSDVSFRVDLAPPGADVRDEASIP